MGYIGATGWPPLLRHPLQRGQRLRQILRQRRLQLQPLARARVAEGEALGVQELALQAGDRGAPAAVEPIAGDWVADRGQVAKFRKRFRDFGLD